MLRAKLSTKVTTQVDQTGGPNMTWILYMPVQLQNNDDKTLCRNEDFNTKRDYFY
jgi:hypothetical protein